MLQHRCSALLLFSHVLCWLTRCWRKKGGIWNALRKKSWVSYSEGCLWCSLPCNWSPTSIIQAFSVLERSMWAPFYRWESWNSKQLTDSLSVSQDTCSKPCSETHREGVIWSLGHRYNCTRRANEDPETSRDDDSLPEYDKVVKVLL